MIMNYTESFQEFSSRLSSTDLMVYGGAALVLFVLFKDKLDPVKQWITNLVSSVSSKIKKETVSTSNTDANFLKLVSSWKNTRDLAEGMGCGEAVKILDTVFPHLGPHNCSTENVKP